MYIVFCKLTFCALRFFDLEEVINLRPPAVSLHSLPSHFVSFSNIFEPGLILPLSNRYNCHCLNHSTHQVRQSWLQWQLPVRLVGTNSLCLSVRHLFHDQTTTADTNTSKSTWSKAKRLNQWASAKVAKCLKVPSVLSFIPGQVKSHKHTLLLLDEANRIEFILAPIASLFHLPRGENEHAVQVVISSREV